MGGTAADFFVSYTSSDRPWAEWIAWQLKQAGSSVVLQAWDMVAGRDFVHEMQRATTTARRTVAVLSPAYFGSQFGEAEWRVAFASDPDGEKGLLVPVRVAEFAPKGLLATRIYIDLVGKDRHTARTALLDGLKGQAAAVPTEEPEFPGQPPAAIEAFEPAREEPRFPSGLPGIWNVPFLRNPAFTGRDDVLEELAAGRGGGSATAITQAIAGLGGVGKTTLAVEYAYRQRARLDVVWWVRAEEPSTLLGDFAGLASALNLAERAQPDPALVVRGVHRWLAGHDRWLLVFDNANRPEDLTSLLPPAGAGQVLVTSRWSAWGEWATSLRLPVLSRPEAVAFLRTRTGTGDQRAAAALAEALGDLPLALAEAAAYIEQTQITIDEYLELVRGRAVELFGLDQPSGAQRRVATVWSLSLERIRAEAPLAEALLQLCAFLAPEDIPRTLPGDHPAALPAELRQLAADPLTYNKALGALGRYSLATVSPTGLGLHRLVQAVIRARLGDQEGRWAQVAVQLLDAAFPMQSWELATWPASKRLLPHLLAATEHAQRLGVGAEQVGALLLRASWYLRGRGQPREARPLAERSLAIAEETLGADDPKVGDRCDELGRVLRELGDYQRAKQQLERALAIHEAAYGPDHQEMATRHSELGWVLWSLGDLGPARAEWERAVQIGEATVGPDHPNMAPWHSGLGTVLQDLGDLDGARAEYERALQVGEATVGPDHPDMARWHNNLGSVLQSIGDLDGARAEYERALEIGEATVGPGHPDMATRHGGLGTVLQRLGDLAGARAEFERALRIGEATLGPDHPDMATRHNNLGDVLRDLGDLAGARAEHERALQIGEATVGPDHPYMAIWHNELGLVLQRLGDLAGARAEHERALQIGEAALGPDHRYVAIYRRNLDLLLRELGGG
jgi:tetratricopeptide (TPR) repeat protein